MPQLAALAKVLPVLLVIALGALLRRLGLLSERTAGELKRLVVNVTLPAILFLAFARLDAQARALTLVATMFAACLAGLLIGSLLRRLLRVQARTFPMLLTGFEAGMMGYALYASIYGAENLHRFALVDLGHVVFVFAVLIPVLQRATHGARPLGETLAGLLRSPVLVAIAAGLVAGWVGLLPALAAAPVLAGVPEAVALVGSLTTPLVALLIGHDLRLRLRGLGRPALALALRLLLWIPAGLAIALLVVRRWLGLDDGYVAAVLLMVVLPPPFVIPIFLPERERDELEFTVSTLALATLVTLVAVTVVALAFPPR
jgi:predicted permease